MYSEILTPDYHMAHNISHVTSENYLIHSHPFYELYYFLSGDVHLLYNGAEYILHPHTFVIFIPNIFHGLHVLTRNPYERYTAHFTPDILSVDRRHMLISALPDAEDLRTTPPQVPFMLEDAQSTGLLSLFQSFDQIAHMPEHLRDTLVSTVTEAILARFLLCTADAGRTKPITPFHKGHITHLSGRRLNRFWISSIRTCSSPSPCPCSASAFMCPRASSTACSTRRCT